jgi:nucleotide-binding universal stress UspA family protein
MYDRILAAIDASPDSPDDLPEPHRQVRADDGRDGLPAARGARAKHSVGISVASDIGVPTAEDIDVRERKVVQDAVDQLVGAGIEVHGEFVEATEHDAADVIVQRARDLDVDIIVLGYQHHRGSVVAEHVISPASALLDPVGATPGVAPAKRVTRRVATGS